MVNIPTLKGVHYAMHAGMYAAEEIVKALKQDSINFELILQKAREIVLSGEIGTVRHVEASYLQSWLVSKAWGDWRTESRWLWRLSKKHGSNGVLGDIGIHAIDAIFARDAHFLALKIGDAVDAVLCNELCATRSHTRNNAKQCAVGGVVAGDCRVRANVRNVECVALKSFDCGWASTKDERFDCHARQVLLPQVFLCGN